MLKNHINPNTLEENSNEIDQIITKLNTGSVIALPTDTVYGLSCLATNQEAIKKIYKLKKRSFEKPFLVLVGSFCLLREYFFLSQYEYQELKKIWQPNLRPTTVLLRARPKLLSILKSSDNLGAVRMPVNSLFLIQLIKKLKVPLVSTSLNLSGKPVLKNPKEIKKVFGKQIDLIIKKEISTIAKSSRLIKIEKEKIKIIRD